MTAPNGRPAPRVAPTDPQELRAEIQRTRAELGQTIEALAARRAVLASNVGGITGIIKDNVTGLLFPPRDASARDLAGSEA